MYAARPASTTSSPGTPEYYDVLARATYLVNNVNFPEPPRQARGHRPRADPSRHAAQADGARPAEVAGAGPRHGLRRAAGAVRALGLQRLLQPLLDRDLGARVPRRATSRSRSATRATTCSPTATPATRARVARRARASSRARSRSSTRRRTASTSTATSRGSTSARLADALGPDHVVLARTHYFYVPTRCCASCTRQGRVRDVASPPLGRGAVPGGGRAASRTTRRSCSTTPCSTARSSSTRPTGRSTARCRGTYFDLMAEPPGPVTRTAGRAGRGVPSRRRPRRGRRASRAASAPASARSTTGTPPSASSGACGSASASRRRRLLGGHAVSAPASAG